VSFASGEEAAAISGLLQHLADLAVRSGGPAPLPEPPETSRLDGLKVLAGNQQFRAVADQAELLRNDISTWTIESEQRGQRETAWSKLNRLLEHAGALGAAATVREQADAIRTDRLLLNNPDPVSPLIDQLSTAIRESIAARVADLSIASANERTGLEQSDGWSQISPEQQADVLAVAGMAVPESPDVASLDALLGALDAQPLRSYQDRIDALQAKAAAARRKIAEIIDPDPPVVTVKPPGATIKSGTDVDAYVSALRDQLIQHVNAGETVII